MDTPIKQSRPGGAVPCLPALAALGLQAFIFTTERAS